MTAMTRRGVIELGLMAAGGVMLAAGSALAADNPMPDELRQAIERQKFSPVLGNPNGDITLTEFFDYNCPFCRSAVPVVQELIRRDKNLRVVLREWPILSEGSVVAAKISLASLKQQKYWQVHTGLMAIRGRVIEASAMQVARDQGLDMAKLVKDMESPEVLDHIEQSELLGDHMGLAGTPTFIAGNSGGFGKQSLADLTTLVAEARKSLL